MALKTLGLLTLMAQSGILIPAQEGSTVPFVTAVFTDLGDDQSIARDLSTFSSHIVNLVEIVRVLAPPALVLLDEPGVGTDPEEGAALAVALVDRLIEAGALVATATHYAPVKLYALGAPGVEVAAVEIDAHSFEPRYRLIYGSVGESLGLSMARRLGLPASVLTAAAERLGTSARELAQALTHLEDRRRRFEDERQALVEERRVLAEREREYADLLGELRERRRARWSAELADAREFLRSLKAEGRALLEVVRRRQPDAAVSLGAFVRGKDEEIKKRAAEVAEPAVADDRPAAIGDQVEVRGTAIRGELVEIAGESARVRRGSVSFRVPTAELRVLPLTVVSARTPVLPARRAAEGTDEAPTELRLIGLRAREALDRLAKFLDQAQSAGVQTVRIVHGLGTGALKRAIIEYLAASSYCTRFRDAEPEQGGPGVTVAELL